MNDHSFQAQLQCSAAPLQVWPGRGVWVGGGGPRGHWGGRGAGRGGDGGRRGGGRHEASQEEETGPESSAAAALLNLAPSVTTWTWKYFNGFALKTIFYCMQK